MRKMQKLVRRHMKASTNVVRVGREKLPHVICHLLKNEWIQFVRVALLISPLTHFQHVKSIYWFHNVTMKTLRLWSHLRSKKFVIYAKHYFTRNCLYKYRDERTSPNINCKKIWYQKNKLIISNVTYGIITNVFATIFWKWFNLINTQCNVNKTCINVSMVNTHIDLIVIAVNERNIISKLK